MPWLGSFDEESPTMRLFPDERLNADILHGRISVQVVET
jgi:hypothetical protein